MPPWLFAKKHNALGYLSEDTSFCRIIAGQSGGTAAALVDMTDSSLKDETNVVVKQYEAIRKELEEEIRAYNSLAITVGLALMAGLISAGGEIKPTVLLLFVPAALFFVIAFAEYRFVTMERELARAEDKVFWLTGLPLLTHETELVCKRARGWPYRIFLILLASTLAYGWLEWFLYAHIDLDLGAAFNTIARRRLLIGFFAFPAVFALWYSFARACNRARPFVTNLARHLSSTYLQDGWPPQGCTLVGWGCSVRCALCYGSRSGRGQDLDIESISDDRQCTARHSSLPILLARAAE